MLLEAKGNESDLNARYKEFVEIFDSTFGAKELDLVALIGFTIQKYKGSEEIFISANALKQLSPIFRIYVPK